MKKIILALAVTGTALTALAAPASAQPRQQCLRNNQIDSFQAVKGDARAIVVTDKFRNKYKLSFNRVCDSVDYNGALAIKSQSTTGLSCIARGDMVISRGTGGGWVDRCVVTSVAPYTAAMERADRDQARHTR
jgi:hypothetical protein